ncbi:MAG: tRNA pseudouridine(55) synthase TruB [Pseudomonadota bacterium]|nr:tRNA pseudouridine(55) synthase TruB [Pseudomonadota bacterium]
MSTSPPVARSRVVRRAVHGVLLLDKPLGASSNTVLQRAKWLYRAEKAGHTGTLDPLASGLLPLCFGAATKFAQTGLDADKRYRATLQLGVTTTTADGEGEVVERRPVNVDRAALERAVAGFIGALDQVPPMHSALKHEGRPLYKLARAGIEVERSARRVHIASIDVVSGEGDRWTLDVACSKGTYVRTLAADIGEALGCGAFLAALQRTATGRLALADACDLERLEGLDEAGRDALLLPVDALLGELPRIDLEPADAARFLTGLRRRLDHPDSAQLRVYAASPPAFLGTAHVVAGELISTRLLSPLEVAAAPMAETCIHRPLVSLEAASLQASLP